MKISPIKTTNVSKNLDAKIKSKKDLTSFGVNNTQTNPNSDIDPQKSAEAMKTTFLSNVSFSGHTEKMHSTVYGTSGELCYSIDSACRYNNGSNTNPVNVIVTSKHYHPNSSVEVRYDRSREPKVYFADPQEVVADSIKSSHEFIVYDNEPKFPSLDMIRNKYFNKYYDIDLHAFCKTIYDYHERLKVLDLKELLKLTEIKEQQEKELAYAEKYKQQLEQHSTNTPWNSDKEHLNTAEYFCRINRSRLYYTNEKIDYYQNRLKNSKEQQELATTLYSILDEAGALFIERDDSYRTSIAYVWNRFGDFSTREGAIKTIQKAKEAYQTLKGNLDTTKSWRELKQNEFNLEEQNVYNYDWQYCGGRTTAEKELESLDNKIKNMEKELESIKNNIDYLEKIPKKYMSSKQNLKIVLSKLENLYPKAEKFYKENAKRLLCV